MRHLLLALVFLSSVNTAESSILLAAKELKLSDLYEKTLLCRDYLKKGLTSDCLDLCKVALNEYSDFPGADRYIGYLYSYKAQCYKRLGMLDIARAHFELTDFFANQQRNGSLELSNKINLAALENDCQNYNKAKRIFEDLLIYPNLDSYYSLREVLLSNLAKTCVTLGETQEAEDYFAELFQIVGFKDVSGELDRPLLFRNYGNLFQKKGDIINAISCYDKALNLYSDSFSENHFQLGNTYKYLAEAYAEIDSSTKALDCYEESLRILRGIRSDESNPGIDDQLSYETVLLQAISSYAAYIYTITLNQEKFASLELAEKAIKMVEEAEVRINSFIRAQAPGLSVFIMAGKVRPLFDAGIQCSMYLYNQTGNELWLQQAFEWSLRSKSYSLSIQAEKEKMIYNEPVAGGLFVKQKELLHSINATSVAGNQLDEGEVSALMVSINKYEVNNDSLEKATARFNNLKPPIENLVRKSKSWKQSLISYHLCDETAFVFILHNGRIDVERIDVSGDLPESVERYKAILLSNRDAFYKEAEVTEFERIGNQLYDTLLSSILKKSKSHSIIIQPDGILLGLPFGLLIREMRPTIFKPHTFRDLDYLMTEYEISYWMGLDPGLSDQEKKSKESLMVTCSYESNNYGMFSEAKSGKGIRGLYSDILMVDDNISSKNLSAYRYVHFASHYSLNDQNPLKSGLVCGQDSEQPYLTLDDILSGSFPDSHIFINGCNSANGILNPGQGLTSMDLVFGISGANEVVAHLWKAEDKVSENLALEFYRKGIPGNYSKRLNRVKQEYLKNAPTGFDHPHFWGGLVGSGKPTEKSKWYIWTGLSILLVGIGFGMSRFGAKGSSTSIMPLCFPEAHRFESHGWGQK